MDLEPLVERPGRQLAAEKEQHGHERRARVGSGSGGGHAGDVRRAREEERRAETATVEDERDDEQQRTEREARHERGDGRGGADERVGEHAAVRSRRSGGKSYAGRARCLNAFTSSMGTASGSPSRHVTTGTPTCS